VFTAAAAWGGAVFLIGYGVRSFHAAARPRTLEAAGGPENESLPAALGTALALSLLNPHVYLDTVVLLGSVAGQYDGPLRAAFAAGAMAASLVWFYGLAYGAARLAPLFRRPAAWRVLDATVGVVMWAIAASLIHGQLSGSPASAG